MWSLLLSACTEPDAPAPEPASPETYAVVMSTLDFGRRAEDGTTWGFDLDNHVSDADDDEGCGHADLVDADGNEGIDSSFSGLVPALEATEAGAVSGLIQDSIDNGELLLLVEVSGVDDLTQDECVDVRVIRGTGTPMIGTDGRVLDGQTFAPDPAAAVAEIPCVPLVDGSVRAGPFALTLDLQVLDVALSFNVQNAFIRLDLAEDGSTGWGYFGGAVPNSDILVIVDEGDLADIADLVRGLVTAAADMAPNGSGSCDALSIVFEYGAVEAFVFEE
jgi:hypothetical protein